MRISDIARLAKAEAEDHEALRELQDKEYYENQFARLRDIERAKRHGMGEDYDVPELLNAELHKRIFSLLNGLWGVEGYGEFTSRIFTGSHDAMSDNFRGIDSSRTLKIPGVRLPLAMDKRHGYYVYGNGARDAVNTSLGLRGGLGFFAIVGECKTMDYRRPNVIQTPDEQQLEGLMRTAGYQLDIETLVNVYSALELDPSVMHDEPVVEPL